MRIFYVLSFVVTVSAISCLLISPGTTQSGGSFVALQGSTPGAVQPGNTNIAGTAIAGQFIGGGSGVTGVNADLFDGLESTSFLQSVPNPLTLTSDQPGSHVIRGENSSSSNFSRGVYGRSTATTGQTAGIRGDNSSTNGYGVLGFMTATSGTNYGGFFQNQSTGGIAAMGVANAATGGTVGVRGDSWSTDGRGVLGFASASTGSTYGVYAQNNSTSGTAVFGTAIASTGITYGVLGFSSSTSGRGVQGNVSATTGATYGGWFQSDSSSGTGAVGMAGSSSGNTVGLRGEAASPNGTGVAGFANDTSGTNYGVYGSSSSTSGYGVFGVANMAGTQGAGVHGRTSSDNGFGVFGLASTSAGGYATGVYGETGSVAGAGVHGVSTNTSEFSIGVFGESVNGTAVLGITGGTGQSKAGFFQNHSDDGIGVFGQVLGSGGMTFAVRGEVSNGPGYSFYGIGDGRVTGDLTVTGSKTGYVSDIVLNGGDEPLEPGDVVEILGSSQPIIGDIPVMIVQKAQLENSLGVLGPVDCALSLKPISDESEANRPSHIRYESPQFHIHKVSGSIKPGAYGRVVTLGSFKMMKVDATFGSIRPGDLLVSSSNPGYAMKAKRPAEPGTVIGKALGSLNKGESTIPVLVQGR